jgi:hypothetical protein
VNSLHPTFRRDFARLPEWVQRQARDAYRRFANDPLHPGLRFKRLSTELPLWSVRINESYRAVGVRKGDTDIIWFFIGTHADYERLLRAL